MQNTTTSQLSRILGATFGRPFVTRGASGSLAKKLTASLRVLVRRHRSQRRERNGNQTNTRKVDRPGDDRAVITKRLGLALIDPGDMSVSAQCWRNSGGPATDYSTFGGTSSTDCATSSTSVRCFCARCSEDRRLGCLAHDPCPAAGTDGSGRRGSGDSETRRSKTEVSRAAALPSSHRIAVSADTARTGARGTLLGSSTTGR